MKILAVSDSPVTEGLKSRVIDNNIDLIITAGDFSYWGLEQLKDINHIPKIGVYGNHCTRGYMQELGIVDLHLNKFEFQGISFAGFEGSVRYKDGDKPMYTQIEAMSLLPYIPKADVMVTHCPPFGINDDTDLAHTGFEVLLKYLETYKPQYWFHGHTYPTKENIITEFEGTKIFYTDPEIIVEI
jgi:uncharacterized protein